MGCSSIPKASPPSTAMRCLPTFWRSPAWRRAGATSSRPGTPPENVQPTAVPADPEGFQRRATLTEEESRRVLERMTDGAATPAQMGAFLMALRARRDGGGDHRGGADDARKGCVEGCRDRAGVDRSAWGGVKWRLVYQSGSSCLAERRNSPSCPKGMVPADARSHAAETADRLAVFKPCQRPQSR